MKNTDTSTHLRNCGPRRCFATRTWKTYDTLIISALMTDLKVSIIHRGFTVITKIALMQLCLFHLLILQLFLIALKCKHVPYSKKVWRIWRIIAIRQVFANFHNIPYVKRFQIRQSFFSQTSYSTYSPNYLPSKILLYNSYLRS